MLVYIQSKSGDFNTVIRRSSDSDSTSIAEELEWVLGSLRHDGGYVTSYRANTVFVPFEEIKFIREAEDGEVA